MSVNLTLVATAAVLVGCGVYLLLERSLTRVLIGLVILSNGVNLAFLVASGPAGESAFFGSADPAEMSDALPQALVLTAIVITLGTVAFLLALAYRNWQVFGSDDVQDDVEDAEIRRLADLDEVSRGFSLDDEPADERADEMGGDEREQAAEDDGRGATTGPWEAR